MLNINEIATNVEIISESDNSDKILIVCNKAKVEVLYMLNKAEEEIEAKYIAPISSIIEDMALYKMNRLATQGIASEKMDVMQVNYSENSNYPQELLNRINDLIGKINPSSTSSSGYGTIDSPFL